MAARNSAAPHFTLERDPPGQGLRYNPAVPNLPHARSAELISIAPAVWHRQTGDESAVSGAKPIDPRAPAEEGSAPASVGRYLIFDEIGVGGMASVHLGMLTGAVGFRRIVALKQLHSRFIHDPDFVAQFINEARLASHIHHANVVQTIDIVWTGTQLLLVLEYVEGDTLNRVLLGARAGLDGADRGGVRNGGRRPARAACRA